MLPQPLHSSSKLLPCQPSAHLARHSSSELISQEASRELLHCPPAQAARIQNDYLRLLGISSNTLALSSQSSSGQAGSTSNRLGRAAARPVCLFTTAGALRVVVCVHPHIRSCSTSIKRELSDSLTWIAAESVLDGWEAVRTNLTSMSLWHWVEEWEEEREGAGVVDVRYVTISQLSVC